MISAHGINRISPNFINIVRHKDNVCIVYMETIGQSSRSQIILLSHTFDWKPVQFK